MWNENKQEQYNDLQHRSDTGQITQEEQTMLNHLYDELEQDEQHALSPSLVALQREHARLKAEAMQLRARNEALAEIEHRYTTLLGRARDELTTLIHERNNLRAEVERVLQ